jgi:tRNA dimethylallyltransferase
MEKINNKIIVILGPTSSGKSDVAIKLAKKFNGEIISADSRQVYRGLDIGTGKTTAKEQKGIKHYLIDIASPRTNYNAAKFKKDAEKIIKDILKRGKLPVICGGTGFWIKSIVDNVQYPEVKPDWVLRNQLRNKSAEELFSILKKLDKERAKNIDAKNKVRLIRAIEICKVLGKVPKQGWTFDVPLAFGHRMSKRDTYNFLQIGIKLPKEKLHKNIEKRLRKRFNQGMIEEVKKLHTKDKLSWKKIESFGLGYFWIPKFLKGDLKTEEELFEKIYQAEKDYAKRQMTWFGKDVRIVWLEKYAEIEKETESLLNK